MGFAIKFAESVTAHLQALTRAERVRVLYAVERRLALEPLVEARNRRPLRPKPVAPWELRVGAMRVFYEVVLNPRRIVRVLGTSSA